MKQVSSLKSKTMASYNSKLDKGMHFNDIPFALAQTIGQKHSTKQLGQQNPKQ